MTFDYGVLLNAYYQYNKAILNTTYKRLFLYY
ncbi:unknown [Prevotella sp. CAG:617]|nr:unknown [Prevotella sp. CAG:617]